MNRGETDPAGGGILVVNAGSSSIKFALYRAAAGAVPFRLCRGEIENLHDAPHLSVRDETGAVVEDRTWPAGGATSVHDLVAYLIDWTAPHLGGEGLIAAGHRVALGGLEHDRPMLLSPEAVAQLDSLVHLAPLHLPANLESIRILAQLHPGLLQVACFDTAFHRTLPHLAGLYGLPRELTEAGARRFGFHGTSYEYIAGELARIDPESARGRTIVAHLGSGASMCALKAGRSVATTMGFSPLSGLMMATRPGDLDPGLVLWMLSERGMSHDDIEAMLYRDSGLKGVSGIGGDMRALLVSDDPRAREAVDLFVYRACREIGSLAAALEGLDALVFTAGIGEHAPAVRRDIAAGCGWLGVTIDEESNLAGGPLISAADGRVRVWVVPTDEEAMIARHTAELVLTPSRARGA